jgi:hypothetical protein
LDRDVRTEGASFENAAQAGQSMQQAGGATARRGSEMGHERLRCECHAVRPGQPRSGERTSARRASKHSGNDDRGADRRACLARGTILPDDHDVVEIWMSTMSSFITTVYRLSTKRRDSLKAFLICLI